MKNNFAPTEKELKEILKKIKALSKENDSLHVDHLKIEENLNAIYELEYYTRFKMSFIEEV